MADESLHILKIWVAKILYLSTILIFFFIPWNTSITYTAIFISCFFCLTLFKQQQASFDKRLLFPFLLFISLYLINVFGMIYTDNMKEGLFRLETKLSLLVFPFIIFWNVLKQKDVRQIIHIFIASTIIACIWCEIEMIKIVLASGKPLSALLFDSRFQYTNLSIPLNALHPTYLSLAVNLSIAYLFLVLGKVDFPWIKTGILILIVVFLIFFTILLASRSGLISLFVVLLLLTFYQHKAVKIFILCTACITFSILINMPLYKDRFVSSFQDSSLERNITTNSISLHYKAWYCSYKMWTTDHILFGYGTGDEKDAIHKCNLENGWIDLGHDAHNEYMSSLVRHGLFGLAVLLSCLFYPLYLSIRHNDVMYIIFIVLVGITFFSESMLRAGNGIMFYAAFNALLMYRLVISDYNKVKITDNLSLI